MKSGNRKSRALPTFCSLILALLSILKGNLMVQNDWWSSSHHNISNFLEIKIEEKREKCILSIWSLLRLLFILSKISIQLLLSSHWKELSQILLHMEEKKCSISAIQLHFVYMQWKCGKSEDSATTCNPASHLSPY